MHEFRARDRNISKILMITNIKIVEGLSLYTESDRQNQMLLASHVFVKTNQRRS